MTRSSQAGGGIQISREWLFRLNRQKIKLFSFFFCSSVVSHFFGCSCEKLYQISRFILHQISSLKNQISCNLLATFLGKLGNCCLSDFNEEE
jgi:hypothetical protein